MDKTKRWRRALSLLMTMLMILTSPSVTTFADVIGGASTPQKEVDGLASGDTPTVTITTEVKGNGSDTIDSSFSGSFYLYLEAGNKHILKNVNVASGQASTVISAVYDGDNTSQTTVLADNEQYSVKLFKYNGSGVLAESQKYDRVQGKKDYVTGSFIMDSCKLVSYPATVTVGTAGNNVISISSMGTVEGSQSAVESAVGIAKNFGAFAMTYSQGADTESTIAANSASLGPDYNFSNNNYQSVNNKIVVTKTYKDANNAPVSGQSVTIRLYRGDTSVKTITQTTGADGTATFTFDKLIYGSYKFYEVINGQEVLVDGKSGNVNVSYTNNSGLEIKNTGFSNYSYFNNLTNGIGRPRSGSYVVLGDCYNTYKDVPCNASIVQAGSAGFDTINFSDYFANILPGASQSVSQMKSGSNAKVYYFKASELARDMNLSSDNGKYIIVNVDTSEAGTAISLPGQYKIDGTQVQANFTNTAEARIVWNFYDYTNKKPYQGSITTGGTTTGIILAPCATVNGATGNHGGTIIAKTYNHTTGEVHGKQPGVESQEKRGSVANTVSSGEITIPGTKTVNGGNSHLDGFKFGILNTTELKGKIQGSSFNGDDLWKSTGTYHKSWLETLTKDYAKVIKVVVNDENGNISFPVETPKTTPTTQYYLIYEIGAANAGLKINCDQRFYIVKVDWPASGNPTCQYKVARPSNEGGGNNCTYHVEAANGIEFDNVSSELAIPVKKTMSVWNDNYEFNFELTPVTADAPMPAGANGKLSLTLTKAKQSGTFAKIEFKTAGTYVYNIKEVAGTDASIKYDDTQYEVTVTVDYVNGACVPKITSIKNTKTGETTVAVEGTIDTGKIVFNNVQKGGLTIRKAAGTGTNLDGKTFYFKVTASDGSVVKNGDSNVWSITGAGDITIRNLLPGTYNVTEVNSDGTARTDSFPYTVSGEGNVTVAENQANVITISNAEITGKITVTKEVTGSAPTTGDKFYVALFDAAGAKVSDVKSLVKGATVSFEKLAPGTYYIYETDQNGVKLTSAVVNGYKIPTSGATVKLTTANKEENVTLTNEWLETSVTFKGTKTTQNIENPTSKNFTFGVFDGNTRVSDGTYETGGNITFTPITYNMKDWGGDTEKTFSYTIKEILPEGIDANGVKDGIHYDKTELPATVTVAYENGTFAVKSVTVNNAAVKMSDGAYDISGQHVFANYVIKDGEWTLSVNKTITGLPEGTSVVRQFQFVLAAKEGVQAGFNSDGSAFTSAAVTVDGAGTADFPAISYKSAGTYQYTLKEAELTNAPGYTRDAKEYDITVTVGNTNNVLSVTNVTYKQNNVDGAVAQTLTTPYTVAFNNTYEASDVDVTIPVNKSVAGISNEKAAGKTFNFELYPADADGTITGERISTAAVTIGTAGTGTGKFPALHYSSEKDQNGVGTYYYVVKETAAGGGFSKNDTVYIIEVTITDDGSGKLKKSVKVNGSALSDQSISYVNEYHANGTVELTAKKTVNNEAPGTRTFDFVLKDSKGNVLQTKQNNAAGDVTFDAIPYTQADIGQTFTYTVSEVQSNVGGITYDTTVYTVTVAVEDSENSDGKLNITKTIKVGDEVKTEITFDNDYNTDSESFQPSVTKTLNCAFAKDGEFAFVKTVTKNDPTFTNKSERVTVRVSSGKSESVNFTEDTFGLEDVGTYIYTIKEEHPIDAASDGKGNFVKDGMTYDGSVYTYEVTISDNGNGDLTKTVVMKKDGTEVESVSAAAFTNTYRVAGAEGTVIAKKVLDGQSLANVPAFTFQLWKGDTLVDTKTNDTDGNVAFSAVKFTKPGTYTYTVKEVKPAEANPAITFDETEKTVTFEVTDNGSGGLNVAASPANITNDKGEVVFENTNAVFNNTYSSKISTRFTAKKTLTGKTLKEGQFTFLLKDESGETIQTKTNAADGTISFDAIEYTNDMLDNAASKTFRYEISEQNDGAKGYTYDSAVYEIAVTVAVNRLTGVLTLEKSVAKRTSEGTVPESEIEFSNTYGADGSVILQASKNLNGKPVEVGQFEFILEGYKGVSQTKANDASGNVIFDKITYDESDIGKDISYTISEVVPNPVPEGYEYSKDVYTVKVTVTDPEGNGELKVEKEYFLNDAPVAGAAFSNYYTADGSITLKGDKTLTGNRAEQIKEGEFSFAVKEDGKTVATGTTADGENGKAAINFTTINYAITKDTTAEQRAQIVGTHTYTVTETNGGNAYIDYSQEIYTVTVEVTDDGEGHLNAEVTARTDKDGNPVSAIAFVNDYKAEGTTEISGQKIFTGKRGTDMAAGEFNFAVVNIDSEKTVGTASNNADGSFTVEFGKDVVNNVIVPFTQTDIGKEFTNYQLVEVKGTDETIDYSKAKFNLKVTVADGADHNGELAVTAVVADGTAAEFTNTYEADGLGEISGHKEFTGNRATVMTAGEFNFAVVNTKTNAQVGTASNDAQGNFTVSFGKDVVNDEVVPFTQADIDNEFKNYQLVEVKGTDSTITYSDVKYNLTVTVADGANHNGKLAVTVEVEDGKTAAFTNNYEAEGRARFTADKVLTGNRGTAIGDKEFAFQAECITAGSSRTGETYDGYYDAEREKVIFDAMTYDESDIDKTYVYRLTEKAGKDKNIKYSTESFYAKVAITDTDKVNENGTAKLQTTVTYYTDEACTTELQTVTFTNDYTAKGSAVLETVKKLEGRTLGQGEFSFKLYENVNGSWVEVKDAQGNALTAVNAADGKVVFPALQYTQDEQGVHQYKITETIGNDTSVTYDTAVIEVSVTVRDENGNGELTTEVIYAEGTPDSFTNKYKANGTVTFTGRKTISGNRAEVVQEGEFTFTVTDDATGKAVATGKTLEGGAIEFTTISYTEAEKGEHHYTITEDAGTDTTITYSKEAVKVTVTVTDNNNGELETVATYPEGGVVFTNYYEAEGGITLAGTKEIIGNRAADVAADEFDFVVTENGKEVAAGTTEDGGAISFTEIKYTQADIGTHTYTVSEVKGNDPAMEYTTDVFEVTVEVTDLGNGKLGTTATYPEGGVKFVNSYNADGSVIFTANKTVNNEAPGTRTFSFELKDADGNVLQTKQNNAAGNVTFDAIPYTQADIGQTFTYTVSEVQNNTNGITCDKTIYTVTVKVEDSETTNGKLKLTETITANNTVVDEIEFNNDYDTNDTDFRPGVIKTLNCAFEKSGIFTFTETVEKDGTVIKTEEKTLNIAEGQTSASVNFAKDTYAKEDVGTYIYTITENHPDGAEKDEDGNYVKDGMTYDGSVYTYEVTITDNGNGLLTRSVVMKKNGTEVGKTEAAAAFTNTYNVREVKKAVIVKKVLEGQNLANVPAFTFELLDKDGAVVSTATNNDEGIAKFNAVTFTQPGIYEYTVREVKPENAASAIGFDETEQKVTFTVSDDNKGGLVAAVSPMDITDEDGNVIYADTNAVFTNTYDSEIRTGFAAVKKLAGKDLKADQFTFVLTEKDAEGKNSKVLEEVKNAADGSVTFADITYTSEELENAASKTFYYELTEKNDGKDGYTYDGTVYDITVTVAVDKETGELTLDKSIVKKAGGSETSVGEDGILFNNIYEADGTAVLEADKKLNGRPIAEGQFEFTLTGYKDVNQTETNDASGHVTFDTVTYDESDVGKDISYTITEKIPAEKAAGYEYSEDVYTVKVTVTDPDDNGNLKVEKEYFLGETKADAAVFTNYYTANGSLKLEGNKELTGIRAKDIEAGEFNFVVKEGEDTVATGTTTAGKDGVAAIDFSEISYAITKDTTAEQREQILGTHTYTVEETAGDDTTIKYDGTIYTVTVNVTDDGAGHLIPEITGIKDEKEETADVVTFTNNYQASGSIAFEAAKVLTGSRAAGIANGEFTFRATLEGTEDVKAEGHTLASENGEAKVVFDELNFTQRHIGKTYTYIISENAGSDEAIGYSKDLFKAEVTIADAGNGGLDISAAYKTMDGEALGEGEIPTFTNDYNAEGMAEISGLKELTGNRSTALKDGEFTFAVINTETGAEVGTAKNDAEGNFTVTFGKDAADGKVTPFTQADIGKEFTNYQLTEAAGDDTTITYSDVKYNLTVTVADGKDSSGTLAVATTVTDGKDIVFTNHYNAAGSAGFTAGKVLTGNRGTAIGDKEFAFQAECITVDSDRTGETYNGYYSAEDQKVVFEAVKYDESDIGKTYVYRLTELAGEDKNITYSAESFYAAVTVTDTEKTNKNGTGRLSTEVKYYEDAALTQAAETVTFTNAYKAEGSAVLQAVKNLEGRTEALHEGEFLFKLYEVTDGTRTEILDAQGNPLTAVNAADGKVIFDALHYTEADQGVHQYEIEEVKGNDSSVTYDTAVIKVSVTVKDAAGNGELTTEVAFADGTPESFTNKYQANGTVTFTGLKKLTGNRADSVKDGEFTFTVTDDATGEKVAAGKTTEGGVIEFTSVSYTEADKGEHTYTITEDKGTDESITYSTEAVKVKVTVNDNNDGTLEATATYPEGGMVFTNQYSAAGSITFTGDKAILGNRKAAVAADEFSFTVTENGKETATGTTEEGGAISFSEIKYTQADIGTHTYTVSEVKGDDKAMEYTEDTFEVTVEVTDLGNGKLGAEATYPEGGIHFVNRYHAAGELVIDNVQKTLEGAKLQEGLFKFQLEDADGNILQTAAAGKDGKAAFEALKYTEADVNKEFTYTVSEVNTDVEGVTYDSTVYTILVKVEDNSDGTLKITQTTMNGEDEAEVMSFANTFAGKVSLYKVDDKNQVLSGAKFQLYAKKADADDYEVYTADSEDGIYVTDEKGVLTVEKLPANDYYFIETEAPTGFVIETEEDGSPVKYPFSIGMVDSFNREMTENPDTAYPEVELTVVNELGQTGSISVTKRTTALDLDLNLVDLVMTDAAFYVNLFTDKEGKVPYSDAAPKVLEIKDGTTATVTFTDIPDGTYYVFETDENGESLKMNERYKYLDGTEYVCQVDGGSSNEVELDAQTEKVEGAVNLNNMFYKLPDGESIRAYINISKKVLVGADEADVDDVFYAGIFTKGTDGEYTLVSVVELENNGTVRTEVSLGGEDGTEPITYYVFETDAEGNRVSADGFAYDVSGEGDVTLTSPNTEETVAITNTQKEQYAQLIVRKTDANGLALTGAQFSMTSADESYEDEWTSDGDDYIMELTPGEYTLKELNAPEGYAGGEDVAITVNDDLTITVNGSADVIYQGNILQYINRPEVTITPAPTVTPTPTSWENPKGKSPKTGDDTPIALYLMLLLIAGAGLTGVVAAKRRKRK